MSTAKAARIHQYGSNGVRVEDIALPEPQAGQVIVKAHAAGVNPMDWKIRAGYFQQMIPLSLPFTLGGDFSGTIESVGPGVVEFRPGDEVYGYAAVFTGGSGAFAGRILAPTASIASKPHRASHHEAAALPMAGVSALQALTEVLKVSAGQKVLIHGGGGGIGSIAIQLAKHLGARVATTASMAKAPYVKSLGANEVIDYQHQNLGEALSGVDAVLDTVGGDTYERSYQVLKRGGRLVSLLEQPRPELMNRFGIEASLQFTQVTSERLNRLAGLVDAGVVKVHIEQTFPLEKASTALQYLEKQAPQGKVIVTLG